MKREMLNLKPMPNAACDLLKASIAPCDQRSGRVHFGWLVRRTIAQWQTVVGRLVPFLWNSPSATARSVQASGQS